MATTTATTVTLTTLVRAHDSTNHLTPSVSTDVNSLSTTTAAYGTDLPAFSTAAYTSWTALAAGPTVDNMELRVRIKIQNAAQAAGSNIIVVERVLNNPSAASDITTQVSALIYAAINQVGYN